MEEPGRLQSMGLQRHVFDPWVGKIHWRRAWQPTPVFLAGESHGQRSLGGCSPYGRIELDTTEACVHTVSFSCHASHYIPRTCLSGDMITP